MPSKVYDRREIVSNHEHLVFSNLHLTDWDRFFAQFETAREELLKEVSSDGGVLDSPILIQSRLIPNGPHEHDINIVLQCRVVRSENDNEYNKRISEYEEQMRRTEENRQKREQNKEQKAYDRLSNDIFNHPEMAEEILQKVRASQS